jgi:cytochrome c oxidase assembly protein Cox11
MTKTKNVAKKAMANVAKENLTPKQQTANLTSLNKFCFYKKKDCLWQSFFLSQ